MNGAESLLQALKSSGVNVCFANPGTSEMHFVAALDAVSGMRSVLGLAEGVVTGAADGYGRMTDKPACTLLHLGPGLANGLSNLHNARRAPSPVVNIVGDHATYHRRLDAPLTSDIEGAARPFCDWVRTSPSADTLAGDAVAAVEAALSPPGRVATLILPADAAWGTVRHDDEPIREVRPLAAERPSEASIEAAVRILRSGQPTAFILAGRATREPSLLLLGRIARATGAKLLAQTFNSRVSRGAGRVAVERIPYAVDQAVETLRPYANLILVGAKAPVGFFAYPNKPSMLWQPGVRIHELARVDEDIVYTLESLADALDASACAPELTRLDLPGTPPGEITPEKLGPFIASILPPGAIVVDESISTGRTFMTATETAHPHEWLLPTGGSIGFGLPLALGAAIACPDCKVIALQSDGSALYLPQALWSFARESLNVLTILFANRQYRILRAEMRNLGFSQGGPRASALLDLDNPTVDWVGLAKSFGVEAYRAGTMEELARYVGIGLAMNGPCLIEAVL